jgi:ATP-dependent helicase/nuclease subunit A
MGSSRVGNVFKLLEIVRNEERKGATSFSGVVRLLEELAEVREIEEISLTPARADAVRLMNLHKAKGLEAPVVFLANPGPLTEHAVDRHVVRVSEGGKRAVPKGYFVFCSRNAFGRTSTVYSQPAGWERAEEEEKRYQEAEQIRLMYVAATRARNMLVVSTYAGNPKIKPWMTIDEALVGAPELAAAFPESMPRPSEPGAGRDSEAPQRPEPSPEIAAGTREKVEITPAEAERARKEIAANIRRAAEPTYAVESVTALSHQERRAGRRGAGLGPVWGRLVHQVLEAIGSGKLQRAKLELFIDNILAAEESDFTDKEGLLAHIEAILGSPFWARVIKAEKRYFEIPFAIKTDKASLGTAGAGVGIGIPVILRGTIDLVFREGEDGGREGERSGGWVIADYKTDRIPVARPALEAAGWALDIEQACAISPEFAAVIDAYAPQIRLYGRFWQQITGERVTEAGLYFSFIDRWVRVLLPA